MCTRGFPTFALLGSGKVGTTLGAVLSRRGYEVATVWSRHRTDPGVLREYLGGARFVEDPVSAIAGADVILFAVTDDALEGLVASVSQGEYRGARYRWRRTTAVHFSGRYGIGIFGPLTSQGATALAAHPALPFTDALEANIAAICGARFGLTGDPEVVAAGSRIVRDIGAIPFSVAEPDRPLYHAALTFASTSVVAASVRTQQVLRSISVSNPEEVLRPLLERALSNSLELGARGVTGAAVRGDVGVLEDHLRALAHSAPDVVAPYREMLLVTVEMAMSAGQIDADRAQSISRLIRIDN